MPCAPLQRFEGDTKAEVGEVMSGVLEVVRGSPSSAAGVHSSRPLDTTGQRVFVRVYRTSSEQHFAVLYPMRAIVTACKPFCSLNLKSCCVKPLSGSGREFRVSPRACDGVTVTFRTLEGSTENHVAEWMLAFSDNTQSGLPQKRKKFSDHRSPLPVLQESEEESEDAENQV